MIQKCPRCGESTETAYCPDCGIRMDPLKCLLAYCRHRYCEYDKRMQYHKDPQLPALAEKWKTYVTRLDLAIKALEEKEGRWALP